MAKNTRPMMPSTRRRLPAALTLLLALCLTALSGCTLFQAEEPPVNDSTLVEVLAELHMLDARANMNYGVPEHARDSIFAHYNVTEEQFEAALSYYADRPEEYLTIYRDVLEAMNREEARMRDRLEEEN